MNDQLSPETKAWLKDKFGECDFQPVWAEGCGESRPWAYYDYLVYFGPKTPYDRVYMLAWENPGAEVELEIDGITFTGNVSIENDQLVFHNCLAKKD